MPHARQQPPTKFFFFPYTQYASDAMATYPATTRQNFSIRERTACSRRVSGTANSDEMMMSANANKNARGRRNEECVRKDDTSRR
jgi:hypothetical protein